MEINSNPNLRAVRSALRSVRSALGRGALDAAMDAMAAADAAFDALPANLAAIVASDVEAVAGLVDVQFLAARAARASFDPGSLR